jgi:4-amino-4-deoxy-L-arabinose transferase-like glycosyltransferase
MLPMRLLVLLICLGMALLLYLLVGRETDPWSGLLAGLILLHWQIFFEGHSANREWFSGIALLAGLYTFSLGERSAARIRRWLLVGAGTACGAALWFKLQAAPLVLPIPLVLAWEAAVTRRWREALERLAYYTLGGLFAVGLHFLPFLFAGTLRAYVESLTTRWSSYVVANAADQPIFSVDATWNRFYWGLPGRGLMLVSLAFCLICLLAMGRRLVDRRRPQLPVVEKRAAQLWVFYLIGAMVAVQMGQRFFDHYYLFLVPAVAALFGFSVQLARIGARRSQPTRTVALSMVALIAIDRLMLLSGHGVADLFSPRPRSVAVVAYLVLTLSCLLFIARWPLRRAATVLPALLWLEVGLLVFQAQLAEPPRSLPFHRQGYDRLVHEMLSRRLPGDRLFVWGWAPEIYSLSRLEAASHFSNCQYIVNDYEARPNAPRLNRYLADMLLGDLEQRPPRFVVDATQRSWTMEASGDPWLYRLELYPDFELRDYLARNYRLLGSFDGCKLYLRRSPLS